jgi:hypothetical protein
MKRLLCIFLALFPLLSAASPNIVMVFIDDMGWGDFSCFGNKDAQTPNIDRIAAEGIRFEQFYVNSPICSPSRCALTTGQYPQRWRITSYLNNRADNARRGVANWLDSKAPTLARRIKCRRIKCLSLYKQQRCHFSTPPLPLDPCASVVSKLRPTRMPTPPTTIVFRGS